MKKVLVIIPHFNKLILLKECILHLENQSYSNFDIMVVDNGSDDGSAEYIHNLTNNDTKFKKILLDKNMGFAYAVNQGIEYSIENEYEYSLLLNNDAYIEDDFIKNIVNSISSSKKMFAVSSLMINYHKNKLVDSFGDNYCIMGWPIQNKLAENVDDIKNDEFCFSACGGASIYNNSVFKKIGIFDENFFAYLEDIDISYRAKLHGYSIKTCKDAKCYHLGSATSGSKYNEFKVRLSARNGIYVIYKNMPILQILFNIAPLFWGVVIKQIFFISKGFGLDYFFGVVDGFRGLSVIKRQKFSLDKIFNYVFIEIELIVNALKYVSNFIKRHLDEK